MDRVQIEKRIPHSYDMVLLDRVVACSPEGIICSSRSHRDAHHPLRTRLGLSALAGIEYAGQAIALHSSITMNEPVSGGVLAVLRDIRWEPGDMSSIDDELVVTASQLAGTAKAAIYRFRLTIGHRQILAGTATVAFQRRAE